MRKLWFGPLQDDHFPKNQSSSNSTLDSQIHSTLHGITYFSDFSFSWRNQGALQTYDSPLPPLIFPSSLEASGLERDTGERHLGKQRTGLISSQPWPDNLLFSFNSARCHVTRRGATEQRQADNTRYCPHSAPCPAGHRWTGLLKHTNPAPQNRGQGHQYEQTTYFVPDLLNIISLHHKTSRSVVGEITPLLTDEQTEAQRS